MDILGTASVRRATDGPDLLKYAEEQFLNTLGKEVPINPVKVSAKLEALYSQKAVESELGPDIFKDKKFIITDLGGSSAEVSYLIDGKEIKISPNEDVASLILGGHQVIDMMQAAAKQYPLQTSDNKTKIDPTKIPKIIANTYEQINKHFDEKITQNSIAQQANLALIGGTLRDIGEKLQNQTNLDNPGKATNTKRGIHFYKT